MTRHAAMVVLSLVGAGCTQFYAAPAADACARPWPLWEVYAAAFIEPDGKVVDRTAHHVTSEGQAYALVHALVAGDAARFHKVLSWTEQHLAGGDLTKRLPAWRWGPVGARGPRAAPPGVMDANAASDADLWLAWALAQAGRVWNEPALTTKAQAVLRRMAAEEVVDVGGLGKMLLPGPVGFVLPGPAWRLNPSYLPVPLIRWAAAFDAKGPWSEVLASTLVLLERGAPAGRWPDWIVWDGTSFVVDPVSGPVGSYDAIRVYAWAAMMPSGDPARARVLARTAGFLAATTALGAVPERVDTRATAPEVLDATMNDGPVGFQAVGQLLAMAHGDLATATMLGVRVQAAARAEGPERGLYGEPAFYYDQNLVLFAQGALEGRWRFGADGAFERPAEASCHPD